MGEGKLTYDWAYLYEGSQPHAPTTIGCRKYTYDLNGNQTGYKNICHPHYNMNPGHEDGRRPGDQGQVLFFANRQKAKPSPSVLQEGPQDTFPLRRQAVA
jgi:hypothetical protein